MSYHCRNCVMILKCAVAQILTSGPTGAAYGGTITVRGQGLMTPVIFANRADSSSPLNSSDTGATAATAFLFYWVWGCRSVSGLRSLITSPAG